jgi:drug/metabolite transporter (DMT)-like permease
MINVLALKKLDLDYPNISSIFLSNLIFGTSFFPLLLFSLKSNYILNKFDIKLGIIDWLQMSLLYIGLNWLNVAKYMSFRASSIIFSVIYSHLWLDKKMNIIRFIGIIIIGILATLIILLDYLLQTKSDNIILGAIFVIGASGLISYSGYLIEKNKNENYSFIGVKLISSLINIIIFIVYIFISNNIIVTFDKHIIWIYIVIISASDIIYYIVMFKMMEYHSNGSVLLIVLDIARRILLLFLSIILFNETYPIYLYICFFVIVIFSFMINSSEQILNKFTKKSLIENIEVSDQV